MGRAPCCDKANVKKGPWSPEEDAKLKSYIEQHGTGGNWIALPQKIGLKRCGKSCRLRWLNYLRPNIKHGGFSEEEDNIICSLYISIGSRWSIIAAQLPGRTDNDIKNYWNTRLKKKLLGKQRKEQQAARRGNSGLIKQEGKRGNNGNNPNIFPADHKNSQNPYWPELPVLAPVPYSSQEPRFNDHASIRKLLIKLGGRFSDEDDQPAVHINATNQQFPVDLSYHMHPPLYSQSINISSASLESVNNNNNGANQFAPTHDGYNLDYGAAGLQMLQGQNNFPSVGLEQMVSSSSSQRLDWLEFLLCEDHMVDNRSGSSATYGESVNIDCGRHEMSSLVCPPAEASNCDGIDTTKLLQEVTDLDELRNPGLL